MINQRLFDHYKINTKKNLDIWANCPRPFDTILIDKNGSCYACECTSWLPQSIGNLQVKSLDDIINSKMHKHLQGSIVDKTYRYCNEHQCSYIKSNSVEHITDGTNIEHLRLAIDDSCNLRCPSCRTNLIFHKEGSTYKLRIKLANKINDWLHAHNRPIQVHIGSDGDPFASHVYRHFMEHTPVRDNIKYSILTNALMFEDFHSQVPHIIENLIELGVSIDGASKETYEKLRLGGNWEKINRNLEYIATLKKEHNFNFVLHMVVQKDNWYEMPIMLELARKYNVDKVYFNKIQDWNTFTNFDDVVVPQDQLEFQNVLAEVKKDPLTLTRWPSLF